MHFPSSCDKINHSQPDNSRKGAFYEEKRHTAHRQCRDSGCAVLAGAKSYRHVREDGKLQLRITVAGDEYGTYSLEKEQTIKIQDTNVCEIKDGKVTMISAQCPDQLCRKQGPGFQAGRNHCLSAKQSSAGNKRIRGNGNKAPGCYCKLEGFYESEYENQKTCLDGTSGFSGYYFWICRDVISGFCRYSWNQIRASNLVTVFLLYTCTYKEAAVVSVIRIVVIGFLFGNLFSILFSLAGAGLSLACMVAAKKYGGFSVAGVSIIGRCYP